MLCKLAIVVVYLCLSANLGTAGSSPTRLSVTRWAVMCICSGGGGGVCNEINRAAIKRSSASVGGWIYFVQDGKYVASDLCPNSIL